MGYLPILLAFVIDFAEPALADMNADYEAAKAVIAAGKSTQYTAVKRAYLVTPDFRERWFKVRESEERILQGMRHGNISMEDLPLAQSLLSMNYASLSGHSYLSRYFEAAGNSRQAEFHERILTGLHRLIKQSGDGSKNRPYQVFSLQEAEMFAVARGFVLLGALYGSSHEFPLFLTMTVRVADELRHRELHFDLTKVYTALNRLTTAQASPSGPMRLVHDLASAGDSAAQATTGLNLYRYGRRTDTKQRSMALEWLRRANRTGNLEAQLALGQLYADIVKDADPEHNKFSLDQAMQHWLRAAARGSDQAIFLLANLRLGHARHTHHVDYGIAYLNQARLLGNSDAALSLARIYQRSRFVQPDPEFVSNILRESGLFGHAHMKIFYARFQMRRDKGQHFDRLAYRWLRQAAKNGENEAMRLLGEVYASGFHVQRNPRTALKWWRDAAESTEDPETINWIAYVLAAATTPDLRDPRLALKLMEELMYKHETSRENYAHLDTWAMAYAALHNFKQAIAIQENALLLVDQSEDEQSRKILKTHMDAFQRGEVPYDVDFP